MCRVLPLSFFESQNRVFPFNNLTSQPSSAVPNLRPSHHIAKVSSGGSRDAHPIFNCASAKCKV
eukprot:244888-Rhodomonas_salina.2